MRLGSKDRARWCIYNCDCLFIELINGGLKLVTFFGQNKHSKRKKKLKHISYNDLKSRIWLQKYKRLWSLHLNRIQICSKSSFKRAKGSKQGRRKVWKSEGGSRSKRTFNGTAFANTSAKIRGGWKRSTYLPLITSYCSNGPVNSTYHKAPAENGWWRNFLVRTIHFLSDWQMFSLKLNDNMYNQQFLRWCFSCSTFWRTK